MNNEKRQLIVLFRFQWLTCIVMMLCICISGQVSAQVGTINLMNAPQSPEAIALSKFSEVPVSLYTGQSNISVPLYVLQAKGVQVPISLNYNSSGIKVKDIPGAVGLGWSLNAGGVITRVVMGYPDDHEPVNGNPEHNDEFFRQTRLNVKNAYPFAWESFFN